VTHRELHDHYFREAKREGYRSRAAYKLIEIDDRRRVLSRGDRVLDCGAAPGSWLQVAGKRVGPKGVVVGVDLKPIQPDFQPLTNIRLAVGDLNEMEPADLMALAGDATRRYDVVISDMAPDTSGVPFSDHHASIRLCERLLDLCPAVLKGGGHLVMKVFEGEAYPELLQRTRSAFEKVKGFKPKASRDSSVEMYVVAHGMRVAQDPPA
jgi:23S rRNA (uridine2552-2'-O)-methyltransferase